MRVLVVGGGGREHALVWKIAASPKVRKLYCAPGNPGIASLAECVDIAADNTEGLLAFAYEHRIDLTVVGPEAPLVAGIVDVFSAHGLRAFGPTQAAARIEGSKAFAKGLMQKYGIPTAAYAEFTEPEPAREYIRRQGAPIVVKADGLAAGKGVIVAMTESEALSAVDLIMREKAFGSAGARVVIEEYLSGEEASLLAFTDGKTVIPMISAQDHKRAGDGDTGPNTGGMGAYAPAPVVTPAVLERVVREILEPAVAGMKAEGCPYHGCLYAGLMITPCGPKVIEFNARFGDPETQVVLPLLDSDIVPVLEACVNGSLDRVPIRWNSGAAVCVVIAAGGYPGHYRRGDAISGLAEAAAAGGMVFHAGTATESGRVVTNGGRVLGVTAAGPDVASAVAQVYRSVDLISFEGMHARRDIAHRAFRR